MKASKKTVCLSCNGTGSILSPGVGPQPQMGRIICPSCGGTGVSTPAGKGLADVVWRVAVGAFVVCFVLWMLKERARNSEPHQSHGGLSFDQMSKMMNQPQPGSTTSPDRVGAAEKEPSRRIIPYGVTDDQSVLGLSTIPPKDDLKGPCSTFYVFFSPESQASERGKPYTFKILIKRPDGQEEVDDGHQVLGYNEISTFARNGGATWDPGVYTYYIFVPSSSSSPVGANQFRILP